PPSARWCRLLATICCTAWPAAAPSCSSRRGAPGGTRRSGGHRSGIMADLDPVIHAQARLRIVATLATLDPDDQITFPRLQELLDFTAGNLSTHLRRLEEAGYIAVQKTHRGRRPV